ncbi:MAG: 2-oxoacid:acceptor oxidoreductase family protein, partial [Propionibacteriaceae bacterium]|nr:2-oxoacid:acceptor oxidoreductase family protein [Propionibacteriaceae bacterium]
MNDQAPSYPGLPEVVNGNQAVAHVMRHVCGGVIGYPITPSTEISETFEAARAEGQLNVWGRHPFFVEAEGEHSAQSGALGAALTGGQYVSNASSSQGILYGMESHYVTAGKKIGGFVLQVAARVVSKHSLNVMAGHDDIYAMLSSGYTILFGSDPQEAADLAAIAYRVSALSLIPVANAMDGFATSHVMSRVLLPEPELLRDFLGDPRSWIPCPTPAQEVLFGAKGRVFQLSAYLDRRAAEFDPAGLAALRAWLSANAEAVEADAIGAMLPETEAWLPDGLRASWGRAWRAAHAKGCRQLVPALVDPDNPGLTGAVQNQPDFQAGSADHRTHFAAAVPGLVRQAMDDYGDLTGRRYQPVMRYGDPDADVVVVGLGSITDDARAVLPHLAAQGIKAAVLSVKVLSPFPEAEFADLLGPAKALTVLERSDDTALTRLVHQALFRAGRSSRDLRLGTAVFGLGSHDVQPRHLIAVFEGMADGSLADLVYLGTQFFTPNPANTRVAQLQDKLRGAYPETEAMALATKPNPTGLLPAQALRIRFHSVGGYGTVATGKLLTDILSGMLGMFSKASPKYGSEKSGAATNYYLTLSPEPVLFTNAQLEDVEVVVSPDHQVFHHDRPLRGLVDGGTFILQSDKPPLEVWRSLPAQARHTIRERGINFLVIDAFAVAKAHAPTPNLETRMMGIAFIGAIIGHVDRVSQAAAGRDVLDLVRAEIDHKFGSKGEAVVAANMAVINDAIADTRTVDYAAPDFLAADDEAAPAPARTLALSTAMATTAKNSPSALFDPEYFDDVVAAPFRRGEMDESPAFPGSGLFMPPASGASKDKGIFRRVVPVFDPSACTACLECAIACPDMAIPNQAHELRDLLDAAIAACEIPDATRDALRGLAPQWAQAIREALLADSHETDFAAVAKRAAAALEAEPPGRLALDQHLDAVAAALAAFPVARTRPLFDLAEKAEPGGGAMFSVVVDPWKCTGCLQCVAVCGPGALTGRDEDEALRDALEARFQRLAELPNTPARITADATKPGGEAKRLLLDHDNYYALVGGHGACKGCGEVTATHLLTALSRATWEDRRAAHTADLEALAAAVAAKADAVDDPGRRSRLEGAKAALEAALARYEGGPTGLGTRGTVVVNSTGCSSVYASTMPFGPFADPWVNSLFQDAQAVAVGVFEGLAAHYLDEVKAARVARLELADAYDPATCDRALRTLGWRDFTADELAAMPAVLTVSGDGAAFDIGFGALSRVLASRAPVKMLVLDSGGYSNTGGQASTASFTGQDADLARHGRAHDGKQEFRKELGLLAAFHPGVFAAATSTAMHGHFLAAAGRMLAHSQGGALLQVYTPCGFEQGFADDAANARSRLAVESRMMPLFVHDPHGGPTLPQRFSLDGNPDVDKPWTTRTLPVVDESGNAQLVTTDLTPAEFAYGEVRFRKNFRPLPDDAPDPTPISQYAALEAADRAGKTPFILAAGEDGRLRRIAVSPAIVALVDDRQAYWQTLRFLAGRDQAAASKRHAAELADLRDQLDRAEEARQQGMDEIAEALAKLVTAKDRSTVPLPAAATPAGEATTAAPTATAAESASANGPGADAPIFLAEEDLPKCTDCGTCYQELPDLFEHTAILVDGAPKQVSRMRPGALDGFVPTA